MEWRNHHERVSGRGWCEDCVAGQTSWGWQLSVGTREAVTCRSHSVDSMQPQGTFQKLLLLLWPPNSKENIPRRRHGMCQSATGHMVDSIRWSDGAWQSPVPRGCGILFSGWRKFYVAGEEHGLTFIVKDWFVFRWENGFRDRDRSEWIVRKRQQRPIVLGNFVLTWHKAELSERREYQLRKFLHKIWL